VKPGEEECWGGRWEISRAGIISPQEIRKSDGKREKIRDEIDYL